MSTAKLLKNRRGQVMESYDDKCFVLLFIVWKVRTPLSYRWLQAFHSTHDIHYTSLTKHVFAKALRIFGCLHLEVINQSIKIGKQILRCNLWVKSEKKKMQANKQKLRCYTNVHKYSNHSPMKLSIFQRYIKQCMLVLNVRLCVEIRAFLDNLTFSVSLPQSSM